VASYLKHIIETSVSINGRGGGRISRSAERLLDSQEVAFSLRI
jgi:hypothetical protein